MLETKPKKRLKNTEKKKRMSTRSLRRRYVESAAGYPHGYARSSKLDGILRVVLIQQQHSSGNQKAEEDAKKDTDLKVKEINELGNKKGAEVVNQLITAVVNAHPEPLRKEG